MKTNNALIMIDMGAKEDRTQRKLAIFNNDRHDC